MLKSNNFQHYKLSTLSFLNIKIPSFSFLKKAILGLYKNLFWHISRKIGKILENFQKVPFKALLKQQKIFSKSLMKMDRFPKKTIHIDASFRIGPCGISAQLRAEAQNDLRKSHDMLRKCTDRAEIPHHWRRNSRTIYCGMRTVCCGLVFNCWLYGCRFDIKKPDHVSCLYIHYAFTS